ncbi:beta-galactosidase [Roseibium denhamense]|uniref:Beta-galactosidase n=1 Tax=Roseibium denhamense TaxID=76305 RepID=A0ABY1NHT0_9HYPH|nr:beta-galactosidase [Roseibium denhamense]MTI05066.1 beta-galactosidase [Roseibium denhamense]SMP10183.1 beta-galactosidase [Roseibium denhamense]
MTEALKRTLGTCYYPEHWPEEIWEADARRMKDTGLTWVRVGEFSWSRLEPVPGDLHFEWLDRAIDILGKAGLKVVLGTPTATPPRWMIDKHPDMVAVDAHGNPRKFGSRRHYCFSHEGYKQESDRIVKLLAERYGRNPYVAAWQTDNEYGCHDTILSYSDAARTAFRLWLRDHYGTIEALNRAWGNVFWSMEYRSFEEIDLPNLTVTEPNPSHTLAFRRFSSDQVAVFNKRQVETIRAHSSAPISHNYMGRITDFDHFKVGDDLEIATWDSYPLGFLEDRVGAAPDHQRTYARQGDPDFQAFHHDLYRAVGKGRWWVMEQQPGPVNWAPYNPAPTKGMMRLWAWEAYAHGAEAVCYFRWRQAPFAQEQMHAGMLRPDNADAPALQEAKQVAEELRSAPDVSSPQAPVALIFDYDADFAWAAQPHGAGLSYFQLVFDVYKALRKLGLSIDILRPETRDFTGYKIVAAPGLIHMPEDLKRALSGCSAQVLLGPRTGARDKNMVIPVPLPPDIPGLDVTVTRVESLRPDMPLALKKSGTAAGCFRGYREELEGAADIVLELENGEPAAFSNGHMTYVGGWCDEEGWLHLLRDLCKSARVQTFEVSGGVRCRDTDGTRIWTNYGSDPADTPAGRIEAAGVLFENL